MLKTALAIIIICVAAIVAGSGLSVVGYQASSSMITVTSTQNFPTATTITSGSISTTTEATQSSVQSTIIDYAYSIRSPGTQYCGEWDETHSTIDQGTVNISFSVTGNYPVDFWMLNPQQYTAWQAISSCSGDEGYSGLTSRIGRAQWDTTVEVPSSGVYYFVFMNENNNAVSISLSVSANYLSQTTEAIFLTSFTTQSSTWQTSALAVNPQQAGLGPVFFLGIVLIAVGAAVFAFSYMRSGGEPRGGETRTFGSDVMNQVTVAVPPPAPPEPVPVQAVTELKPAEAATEVKPKSRSRRGAKKAPNIFCPQCGAELPADSTFCNKCGSKIDAEE